MQKDQMVSSGLHLIFQVMDFLYFGHEVIKVTDFEMNPGYEIEQKDFIFDIGNQIILN